MDGIEQLRQAAREGRISVERLLDMIAALEKQLADAQQRNRELQQRIEELETRLGAAAAPKLNEPFSVAAEEKRQQRQGKKKRQRRKPTRRGRISNEQKRALASRTESIFPAGAEPASCRLSHTRYVWRLEQGNAVLIAYEIYRLGNRFGQIPGALGRSEYGLEIILAIAFQVYVIGLSFDKVCVLMSFFQGLKLRKSQADALLYRLSQEWEQEFDCLCGLLAHSAVVHADETSWSLKSVWAFLSEQARLVLFGVPKDAATLQRILDPETFAGIVVSDDAAVYGKFTHAQKCWAHLLRKAIKLTLLEPENSDYRQLTDRLLEIYRAACRVQRDGRYGDAGRREKVLQLEDEVLELVVAVWVAELPKQDGPAEDYRLLCNELMRLLLAKELFTFVTAPPVTLPNGKTQAVAGTNNETERTLRGPAQARVTGRTNKTLWGARRRTVIVSVLESLRVYLPTLTLPSLLKEIQRWAERGESCFAQLARQCGLEPPETSTLDYLFPLPES
jgi:hypothetical protein